LNALRPINPDNARGLRITAAAGRVKICFANSRGLSRDFAESEILRDGHITLRAILTLPWTISPPRGSQCELYGGSASDSICRFVIADIEYYLTSVASYNAILDQSLRGQSRDRKAILRDDFPADCLIPRRVKRLRTTRISAVEMRCSSI